MLISLKMYMELLFTYDGHYIFLGVSVLKEGCFGSRNTASRPRQHSPLPSLWLGPVGQLAIPFSPHSGCSCPGITFFSGTESTSKVAELLPEPIVLNADLPLVCTLLGPNGVQVADVSGGGAYHDHRSALSVWEDAKQGEGKGGESLSSCLDIGFFLCCYLRISSSSESESSEFEPALPGD